MTPRLGLFSPFHTRCTVEADPGIMKGGAAETYWECTTDAAWQNCQHLVTKLKQDQIIAHTDHRWGKNLLHRASVNNCLKWYKHGVKVLQAPRLISPFHLVVSLVWWMEANPLCRTFRGCWLCIHIWWSVVYRSGRQAKGHSKLQKHLPELEQD